jgi:TRAP-type C4-dicarboxylate transport system permease small subunit
MNWLKHTTARVLGGLCVLVFTALVIDVLWGVATRYIVGRQAFWTEELARFLLLLLAMLGAALAYIEDKHLGVDALTRALHPSARRITSLLTHMAVFFFASGVMIYGGGSLFFERLQAGQMMSSLPMKKAWFYSCLPISGFLIAVFSLDAAMAAVRKTFSPAPDETVGATRRTEEAKAE